MPDVVVGATGEKTVDNPDNTAGYALSCILI
jgi:hypothetical protein